MQSFIYGVHELPDETVMKYDLARAGFYDKEELEESINRLSQMIIDNIDSEMEKI